MNKLNGPYRRRSVRKTKEWRCIHVRRGEGGNLPFSYLCSQVLATEFRKSRIYREKKKSRNAPACRSSWLSSFGCARGQARKGSSTRAFYVSIGPGAEKGKGRGRGKPPDRAFFGGLSSLRSSIFPTHFREEVSVRIRHRHFRLVCWEICWSRLFFYPFFCLIYVARSLGNVRDCFIILNHEKI